MIKCLITGYFFQNYYYLIDGVKKLYLNSKILNQINQENEH